MTTVSFRAREYHADQSLRPTQLELEGSTEEGWTVRRNGRPHLELGPGYRLLRTQSCGVCSTDLARHFLPFPLPQVTGHEIVAARPERSDGGAEERYVVEINASHHARGLASACPFCANGLEKHCPERVVLGIHDLPGGFGAWVLAPVHATLAIPEGLSSRTAVLTEPFAAALNAVETVAPRAGDRIAVLGPRRLGLLVIAALAARRRASSHDFEILALSRHPELCALAGELGATRGIAFRGDGEELEDGLADVVIDTTGNPGALGLASRLAARELHLKSTHGQAALGLEHLTELVVDELSIARFDGARVHKRPEARLAWLSNEPRPELLASATSSADANELARRLEHETPAGAVPRFDAVVVSDADGVDRAIRPSAERETSLVRPRGEILLWPSTGSTGSPLLDAVVGRGLRVSSSRCGDFGRALELLENDPELADLGERFVTHRFASTELERAFEVARSPECIKAVIEHPRESEPASITSS